MCKHTHTHTHEQWRVRRVRDAQVHVLHGAAVLRRVRPHLLLRLPVCSPVRVRVCVYTVRAPQPDGLSMKPQYTIFAGAAHLASGLAGGFSGLAAGVAIGIVVSCPPLSLFYL